MTTSTTTTTIASNTRRCILAKGRNGVWTYGISSMPHLLVSHHIPQELWRKTCQLAMGPNTALSNMRSDRFKYYCFLALLAYLVVSSLLGQVSLFQAVLSFVLLFVTICGWANFAWWNNKSNFGSTWRMSLQELEGHYLPYDIELRTLHVKSKRALMIGRIGFASADESTTSRTATPSSAAAVTSVIVSENNLPRNFMDDRKTLNDWRENGIWTKEEFTIAKSRIFNTIDNGDDDPFISSENDERDCIMMLPEIIFVQLP